MLDIVLQRWAGSYKLYLSKIKKSMAILFTENLLFARTYIDTFAANNAKKGKCLQ